MKRKLFLGLAALAALTITSCQKDLVINQIPEEQPIEFGTYVGRDAQTKASEQTISTLQVENVGFGVYAYYTGTSDYSNTTSPLNFMIDEKVTYQTDKWGYTNTKYWPSATGEKFTFIAYAPGNETTNITAKPNNTTNGDPKFTFNVNSTVASQTDLLYATNTYTTKETNDEIVFNFKHALSRISFSAKPASADDKITINSIKLTGSNFVSSATFNITDGSFTGGTGASTDYSPNPITTEDLVTGANFTSIINDGNYIMIIPVSECNLTITVNYTIKVKDNNLSGGYAAPVTKEQTGTLSNFTFGAGKAYNFQLTISPNDPIIFGAPSVTPWIDDTGNPAVNPEVNEEVGVNA